MKQKIFALGFFDGVHRGHQVLLAQCRRLAAAHDATPAAITFDRHPLSLFSPPPPLISTVTDRVALLEHFGMEQVQILHVCADVMATPWQDFLSALVQDGVGGFVCGDDFRFGAGGAGDCHRLAQFCRENGLPCSLVPEQKFGGQRISSTAIRAALERGDLAQANSLLGHPYRLTGQVIGGRHIGRTIGAPTANLHLPGEALLPVFGVYACKATVADAAYAAVTNVGIRPTVGGEGVTVEPWLLDFQGDLYGRTLTLEFHHYLRPERKFDGMQELRAQIQADARMTRNLLPSHSLLP